MGGLTLDDMTAAGALLDGHFRLSSGLHSPRYLQCALFLADPARAEAAGRQLAARLKNCGVQVSEEVQKLSTAIFIARTRAY